MKKLFTIILSFALILSSVTLSMAHSGGTDSQGGHKDNKNASGLGSYHYHHGYGPHLHPGGVCPYSASTTTSTTTTTTTAKPTLPSGVTKPTFPVMVNGTNLNNYTDYSPVVINNVTYVPLSSDVIKQLNLEGGWVNNTDGLVLKSK